MMRARRARLRSTTPLAPAAPLSEVCLEIQDHSTTEHSAVDFFKLRRVSDPQTQAARLADQFISQNRPLLNQLSVTIHQAYDGSDVRLILQTGNRVGAIPLVSPSTARPDFGLVVQPRFPWAGIGPMLAEMGWRIAPTPLRLPLLHRSERRVPPWVLSSMILMRLKLLLDSLDRRFEIVHETRPTPRGTVNWSGYASRSLPTAGVLRIPCTYPDLRDDRLLKGAIRHTLQKHLRALQTQTAHGSFIHRLIDLAEDLLRRVHGIPAHVPSPLALASWLKRPLRTDPFQEGIKAIEWTVEDRGLAGLSDLEGIPWKMEMDKFFEAWLETLFQSVARKTGATFRVGRKKETVHAIAWDPPYLGSQKSLIPDLWLEWPTTTLIVDAKYKRHWEEMQFRSWANAENEMREQHRADLLQVLAYANLARTRKVIACLAYPCAPTTWNSLRERGRSIHRAEITVSDRTIDIWLTAFPMATRIEQVSSEITDLVQRTLQETAAEV